MLLADEPTGALDTETTSQIMALFCELHRGGMTVVLVTHEPQVAAYAERIIRFRDGRIVVDGSTRAESYLEARSLFIAICIFKKGAATWVAGMATLLELIAQAQAEPRRQEPMANTERPSRATTARRPRVLRSCKAHRPQSLPRHRTCPESHAIRTLGLREAIELALRGDPSVASAVATRERSDLAILRAQLDRFSIRVDTFLTEQWRASNLGGSAPPAGCSTFLPTSMASDGTALGTPVQLFAVRELLRHPDDRSVQLGAGPVRQGDSVITGWQGQFNLAADLRLPLFTGFRITANVARSRHLRDSAAATVRDNMRQVALSVLRAYWTVRRVELQQEVSQQALARFKRRCRSSRRGYEPAAAQADINRMETRRQSELARRADLTGSADEARAQLAVAGLAVPACAD